MPHWTNRSVSPRRASLIGLRSTTSPPGAWRTQRRRTMRGGRAGRRAGGRSSARRLSRAYQHQAIGGVFTMAIDEELALRNRTLAVRLRRGGNQRRGQSGWVFSTHLYCSLIAIL
jgi:hypothetical protein